MGGARHVFRLAHLTDVHLGPVRGFTPQHWSVKRALGFINWHRKRKGLHRAEAVAAIEADLAAQQVDHIAVTGDLINIALPEEYAAAALWLTAIGGPHDVSVVPGNHDIYTRLRREPGVVRWQAYMTSDAAGGVLAEAAGVDPAHGFPYVRRRGDVALVGLNSALPTAPGVAAGELGHQQIDALARVLAVVERQGLFRLVMIHHPPLPGQAPRRRGLRDAAALAAVLARHGADLVIHGHNHVDMLAWQPFASSRGAGWTAAVGAASASMARSHGAEPMARYNIYEIARDGSVWRIERVTRGLLVADGPVVELSRTRLAAPSV